MPRKPQQFDLFESKPASGGEEPSPPPPSDDEGLAPVAHEEPYEPTPEDEQARLDMEHGPGVTYRPPKSRQEREAEKRQSKRMMDDALGRMGAPGRQLLTDAESPFVQGQRDEDEKRKWKKK